MLKGLRGSAMKAGDRVLRFASFPFDHKWSPPLRLAGGLSAVSIGSLDVLDWPGESLADRHTRRVATAASLVPFYGLPGHGHDYFALVADADHLPTSSAADERFFMFLTALRLRKPLPLLLGGSYKAGSTDGEVDGPIAVYHQDAPAVVGPVPSGPEAAQRYTARDLRIAAAIMRRMLDLKPEENPQLINAWACFAQASLGSIQSAQFMATALFAVLEALLTPGYASSKVLARRTAVALGGRQLGLDAEGWVENAYAECRNAFAHGDVLWRTKAKQWGAPLHGQAAATISTIHEIARLVLLRWLLQRADWRREVQASKGAALDGLTYARSLLFETTRTMLDAKAH